MTRAKPKAGERPTSNEGLMTDAHPTAPGGMSRKNLIAELVDEHGYEDDAAAWRQVSWPDLIDLVVEERKEREAEQAALDEAEHGLSSGRPQDFTPEEFEGGGLATAMFDDERTPEAWFAAMGEPDVDDMFADYEAPEVEYHEDGTEHDQIECFHASHDIVSLPVEDFEDTPFDEDGVLDPEVMFAEMAAEREAEEAKNPPLFLGIPGVRDYIFDGHAGAGPSGAERWMNCTMSLSASRAFLETLTPNQQREFAKGTTAARQGTTAHAAAEVEANFVLGHVDEAEVDATLLDLTVSPPVEDEAYDDEMGEYIREYVDLVRGYADERGVENIFIEQRVEAIIPLTGVHEGETYVIRGSLDFGANPTKKHRSLVVGDLKYGNGIDVDVDSNPQIREYALGKLAELADPETGELPTWLERVDYYIVQPRLGGIKEWSESIDELLDWRDEVLAPELTKALFGADEGATFNPSDLACQWCPARGTCPALAEQRIAEGASLFEMVAEAEYANGPGAFPETVSLSDARLGELLTMAAGVKDIYSSLREEVERRLHRGQDIPGWWLVNYTPRRTWKSEPSAQDLLDAGLDREQVKAVFKPREVMTPPQAEKVLGAEGYAVIEAMVDKPDKRPVVSTGTADRRKRWEGTPPEAMFPDETETEGEEDV